MMMQLSASPSPRRTQKRQRLADLLRLIEHQVHVFQMLLHVALRREIARDHLLTLGVHDLRIGRGRPRHLQECRQIEPDALGEHHALGERHAIEAQDQIDRELGAAAVADLADMEALRKQHVEHRLGLGGDGFVAADQADTVAVANLLAGARHRRFEKPQLALYALAKRGDAVGIAGRGAQHDLARRGSGKRVSDDIFGLIGVEHRKHDRLTVTGDVGERTGACAKLRNAFHFRRIDVMADNAEPCREQAARVDLTHQAKPDDAYGCTLRHGISLIRH
jgi:hypothetical protein